MLLVVLVNGWSLLVAAADMVVGGWVVVWQVVCKVRPSRTYLPTLSTMNLAFSLSCCATCLSSTALEYSREKLRWVIDTSSSTCQHIHTRGWEQGMCYK